MLKGVLTDDNGKPLKPLQIKYPQPKGVAVNSYMGKLLWISYLKKTDLDHNFQKHRQLLTQSK